MGHGAKIIYHIVEMYLWHLKHVAGIFLIGHGGRVHDPRVIAYRAWLLRLNKMAKVLVGLHVSPHAALRFEVNVERAIVHLEHHRLPHSLVGHGGEVLRPPRHEVLAVSRGKASRVVIDGEQQSP